MARTLGILSCILCLLLSVELPGGIATFAQASSVPKSSSQSPSAGTLPKYDHTRILSTNTTNTTNVTQSPTPATVPSSPTPQPTHSPTKQYHPSPDEQEGEEKKETKIGVIFGWIVFTFALIWAGCYFRDAIFFFLVNVSCFRLFLVVFPSSLNIVSNDHPSTHTNTTITTMRLLITQAWNNTKRGGFKGCLSSFFPFIFRSRSGGAGSEPLDQIIFESEDPNLPLMN